MLYLLLTTYYSLILVGVEHPPPLRNLCKSFLLCSPICGWIREREGGRGRENSSRCIWCDLTPRSSHTEYMEVLCRTRVGTSKSYTTNTGDKQSITRECALSLTQLPILTHDYPSSLLIIIQRLTRKRTTRQRAKGNEQNEGRQSTGPVVILASPATTRQTVTYPGIHPPLPTVVILSRPRRVCMYTHV